MDLEDRTSEIRAACSEHLLCNQQLVVGDQGSGPHPHSSDMTSQSKNVNRGPEGTSAVVTEVGLRNGTCEIDTMVALDCTGDGGAVPAEDDHHALSNDGMSDLSNSDLSLPEVCVSTNDKSFEEEMNYEVQQAYRIFSSFLVDKYKSITAMFLCPVGHRVAQHGTEGDLGRGQAQLKQSMCLQRMKEKFVGQEYESITEFVADFRLMLENCYRHHGVDHWISKQAQKLEILLEQKLTLLSRMLREKTSLAVTSKGRFGSEEERGSGGTSTRRRLAPRSLNTMSVSGHESVMVQTLRLEEQQRAKDERRQRELERKEAEEMSAKEVDDWEQSLLLQASPHPVETLWELPAIGHFLCLAQTALNLPEIIFFELERCLLLPRCSSLLSKIMTSLLSLPQRRATLHRRPALPYRRWEWELRQRVVGWYRAVGASRNQTGRAEQLGLCHQFFSILGEVSPLEEKPFHVLPFYQRVWLLKGLCDHVYETQKEIQDSLLSQPIHECRESILGYDSKENAYIHFPHFCGADLRIYCQSPSTPPAFPLTPITVKAMEKSPDVDADLSGGVKDEETECNREDFGDFGSGRAEPFSLDKDEGKIARVFKTEGSESGLSCDDSELNSVSSNSFPPSSPNRCVEKHPKERLSRREPSSSSGSTRTIEAETQEPCLSVGEYSYTGRSPARPVSQVSPVKLEEVKMAGRNPRSPNSSFSECSKSKSGVIKPKELGSSCHISGLFSSERARTSKGERLSNKIWTKRKKSKKKRPTRVQGGEEGPQLVGRMGEAAKSAARRVSATIKRKDKKKKPRTGKKLELSKTIKDDPPVEPSFKLVCTNLEELRGLISRIEDELDDLESTKNRLGRWYYRREAVKELHSTLIRLLNELSPWEPKLVKAFQRNRLRLKKEFDDYKKHPEYSNFVREEAFSSSSSSSSSDEEKDEERGLDAKGCSLSDPYRRFEEDDLEVPRGLWKGASTREMVAGSDGPLNHLNPLDGREIGVTLLPRLKPGGSIVTSREDPGPPQLFMSNRSTDSDPTCPSRLQPQASPVVHPAAGLPKGYTPIPTLLAKSVGNKVTLMKRPADYSGVKDSQKRGSLPTSVVVNAKAQNSSSVLQNTGGLQLTEAHSQPAALSKAVEAKPRKTVTKNALAVNCTAPEKPAQPTETRSSSPTSVRPFVDQNSGESVTQVVILPSKVPLQKDKELASPLHQQQSSGIQMPVPNVSGPLCMSTNVPGFTIPENKIPVQQVAPLKNTTASRTPVSLRSQEEVVKAAAFKGTQIWNPPFSFSNSTAPMSSSSTSPSISTSTEPCKSPEHKQLRTVCIRDSQSILVTTRGGNTGIVTVQSSSDQNAFSPFSKKPVITISPQLKAFLVSKATQNLSPLAPAQTPCTIPAVTSISGAQAQRPVSTIAKSHDTFAITGHPTVPSGIPTPDPTNTTAHTTLAFAKGSNSSVSSPENTAPCRRAAGASSTFQPSVVKNPAVTSPSRSSPQVLPQAEFTNKTGVKRASPEEISQHAKFILVSPTSLSTVSKVALPKSPPSSTGSLPTSGVMFFSQPSATFTSTSAGNTPAQSLAAGAGGQPQSTSQSNLKIGFRPGQPVGNPKPEASTLKDTALPSGVQFQLSGRTTMIGQTIGALSLSPSKSTPVSVCGTSHPAAVTTALSSVMSSSTISSSSSQHVPRFSLPSSCQQQVATSFTSIRQPGTSASSSSSAPAAPPMGDNLGTAQKKTLSKSPAQVTNTVQSVPGQTPPSAAPSQPKETSLFSQPSPSQTPICVSPAANTNAQFSPSSTGTIQQRIVINTSAPLAAGTQILFNNARFVVPPQGLGPGSHILVISSPAPQQMPPASLTSTGALQRPPHDNTAPQGPVSSQSPVRLPTAPAVSYPFVACAATADCVGSAVSPGKTNGSFAPPPACTPTLVSFPSRLGAPGPIPPVAHNVPVANPALANKMLPAGTAAQAECSPAVAHSLSRMSTPVSPLPVVSSPPVPTSSVIARTPALLSSLPAQQVASVTTPGPATQAQQGAAASSIRPLSHGPLHIKNLGPALIQTMLTGTKTQAPSTVAIPSVPAGASRMQTLPIATVPPVGSIVHTFETAPMGAAPSSDSTILMTSAQPLASLKTNLSDTPGPNNQALHSLEPSSKGIQAYVASRLLISPDRAVLNTVQCQSGMAGLTACSGTKDSRVVFHNSSTGELRTHGSDLQPSQAEKLRPCQH